MLSKSSAILRRPITKPLEPFTILVPFMARPGQVFGRQSFVFASARGRWYRCTTTSFDDGTERRMVEFLN